ncbi:hypothetical protein BC332_28560 [Capsicum chinense]|nr:hypothetical protein BC332_28560 [Capsicum chinense]
MLSFKFPDIVVHHSVIKLFTTKLSVSCYGFHLKNTLFNGDEGNIEGTTTKIKDKSILLTNTSGLFVKTISNGNSCGLINNTHDILSRP